MVVHVYLVNYVTCSSELSIKYGSSVLCLGYALDIVISIWIFPLKRTCMAPLKWDLPLIHFARGFPCSYL